MIMTLPDRGIDFYANRVPLESPVKKIAPKVSKEPKTIEMKSEGGKFLGTINTHENGVATGGKLYRNGADFTIEKDKISIKADGGDIVLDLDQVNTVKKYAKDYAKNSREDVQG